MTQETLAELASLNYKYIGRVELGKADPGADVLVRLARALRVPVGELFETITPSGSGAPRSTLALDDVERVAAALQLLTAAVERLLSPESRPLAARAPRRPSR
jgi:transcriptional regulator with XRE-family HTH domain